MNAQFPPPGNQNTVIADNMPRLSGGLSRGLNKMALVYVAIVSVAVIGLMFWVMSSAFSADESRKQRVRYEEVQVPNKPVLQLPPPPPAPEPPKPVMAAPLPVVERDDLLERRMANQNNLLAAQANKGEKSAFFEDEYSSVKRGAVQQLANADFTLTRGTFIRCALETQVVSTHPGMTSCIVTEPIYSVNGRRLLVDKGSKMTGEYKYVDEHFDRIGIVWTRILTTTGLDVRIDSAGTDPLGGAGVPGIYDGHWGERIGSALLVSLLADAIDAGSQKFAERNNIRGRETTQYDQYGHIASSRVDPWESQTADTTKRAATEMFARSANRKATVTVLNGTIVNIFAARDVDFSSVMR
jgi:type IV secretion system protein VirB10